MFRPLGRFGSLSRWRAGFRLAAKKTMGFVRVVGTRRVDGRVPNCLLWAWGVGNDVNVP